MNSQCLYLSALDSSNLEQEFRPKIQLKRITDGLNTIRGINRLKSGVSTREKIPPKATIARSYQPNEARSGLKQRSESALVSSFQHLQFNTKVATDLQGKQVGRGIGRQRSE